MDDLPASPLLRPRAATTSTYDRPRMVVAAFADFYREAYPPMVRVAYLIVGSQGRAEEIVQDAFVRVHARFDRLDNPAAYLRTAVVNGCRDGMRRERRLSLRLPGVHAEQERTSDDEPTRVDDRLDLAIALAAVPARARAVLVLRYYEGLSEAEIAETLGISTGTVKSLAHRGLARLREEVAR